MVSPIKAVSSTEISIASQGHCSTHLPQPRHCSASMIARSPSIDMARTKQISSIHSSQPVHRSATDTVTPGIRLIFLLIIGSRSGSIFQMQQHGQQLQMVSNLCPGPAPSQIVSILFRPIRCTRPASRQSWTCLIASSRETRRPSFGLICSTASPRKRQPKSDG